MVPRQRLIAWPAAGWRGARRRPRRAVARAADAKVAHRSLQVVARRSCTSTSDSASPGTGSGPTRCTRSPAISANDLTLDSDPSTREPDHRVGDTFQLTFSQPGVYEFQCKLHPVVHGEVIVSDTPGRPRRRPGPDPAAERRPDAAHAQRHHTATAALLARRDDAPLRARRLVDRSTPRSGTARMGGAAPTPAGSSGAGTSASTRSASRRVTGISTRAREATSPTSRPPTSSATSAGRRQFASGSRRRGAADPQLHRKRRALDRHPATVALDDRRDDR